MDTSYVQLDYILLFEDKALLFHSRLVALRILCSSIWDEIISRPIVEHESGKCNVF